MKNMRTPRKESENNCLHVNCLDINFNPKDCIHMNNLEPNNKAPNKKSKLVEESKGAHPASVDISALKPDRKNANRGASRGAKMLLESLKSNGAGRSILLDKDNNIIAGNKTFQQAKVAGIKNVRVIETDGHELIAVKRVDLDLYKDDRARGLAYADNRVSEIDLDWDSLQIKEDIESGLDLSSLWSEEEIKEMLDKDGIGDQGEISDISFSGAANLDDDICQVIIYCPVELLEEIKPKVMALREEYSSLVVRYKDGL